MFGLHITILPLKWLHDIWPAYTHWSHICNIRNGFRGTANKHINVYKAHWIYTNIFILINCYWFCVCDRELGCTANRFLIGVAGAGENSESYKHSFKRPSRLPLFCHHHNWMSINWRPNIDQCSAKTTAAITLLDIHTYSYYNDGIAVSRHSPCGRSQRR